MGKKIHKYTPAHTYTHNCDKYRMKNFGIKKKNFFFRKKNPFSPSKEKKFVFLIKKKLLYKKFR